MDRPTGYEPLYTLKNVAPDIWIADGGWIRFYGVPFPTRMTVIRLSDGGVWVHSPIDSQKELLASVSSLGPVRYLIAPNWIHYAWLPEWQEHFPDASVFVSPGVVERAEKKGVRLDADHELGDEPPSDWTDEIDQRLADSGWHREVVFFHRASKSLVLTDLIENLEASKMPWWTRPFLKMVGICDPHGGMPRDIAATFRRHPAHMKELVSDLIAWNPERIILAHGRWYQEEGTGELQRALARYLK